MEKFAKAQNQFSALIMFIVIDKKKFAHLKGEEYGFITGLFNAIAERKLS